MTQVSSLSLRVAGWTALSTAVAVASFWVYANDLHPLIVGALVAGIASSTAYYVHRSLTASRLRDIQQLLAAIESKSFDSLDDGESAGSDELTHLKQQAIQAGISVRKEMDRLRQMESFRRDFIGNVSHELKTPIFAIKGFSETLLGGAIEDVDVNHSFVRKILRNADRLDNLARDLSEISAIETGQLQMVKAPFSIEKIVKEVLESLEPLAEEKGIAIRELLPATIPDALGDAERIRQVLTNLIDNALKYTNAGGHVEVVVRFVAPDEIKISVVDDGIGIAPEHVSRLTERFYRVDKSRSRSQGGTGLGLSIVKHILAAHGRRLQVHSAEGGGSTFGFVLDAVRDFPGEMGPSHGLSHDPVEVGRNGATANG